MRTASSHIARYPLGPFFAWLSRRRAAKTIAAEAHRRKVIMRQIAERREKHREWKPLTSDLRRSTLNLLAAEVALRGRG